MRVLVYEDNLIWSSRLLQSLRALGHDPILIGKGVPEAGAAAIVNLSSSAIDAANLVPQLVSGGVHVIGHAGHKEKDLLELGRASGCQTVATNSQLTFKLQELLDSVAPGT